MNTGTLRNLTVGIPVKSEVVFTVNGKPATLTGWRIVAGVLTLELDAPDLEPKGIIIYTPSDKGY